MTHPTSLFDGHGDDEGPTKDDRLKTQLVRVYEYMNHGWFTLEQISNATGAPTSSVSARIRDLRKPRFGGYTIHRRLDPQGSGLYFYRLDRFSGDPSYVYHPQAEPRSAKAEARDEVRDWLERTPTRQPGTTWGIPTYIRTAIQELMK